MQTRKNRASFITELEFLFIILLINKKHGAHNKESGMGYVCFYAVTQVWIIFFRFMPKYPVEKNYDKNIVYIYIQKIIVSCFRMYA